MRFVMRVSCGVALLIVTLAVPAAMAQSEELQAAVELFERHEYVNAQAKLLEIDRDALSADEQAHLDALLEQVPIAIQAKERGMQELAAGDEAYEAGSWDAAAGHYAAVKNNTYVTDDAREYADQQIARIREKQALADAAAPTDIVEPEPVAEEPTPQDEPEPAPKPEPLPTEPVEQPAPQPPAVAPAPVEDTRRLTPTDQLRIRDELLWQRAVAKSQALADAAREAMGRDDYVEARQLLDTAFQAVDAARGYAEPVSKYHSARDGLTALRTELSQAAEAYNIRRADDQRREIAEQIAERKRRYEAQKAEKVDQLFSSANQLRNERRFGEAAEVLREVLRIDPGNAKARYQLEVVEDYESFSQQERWQKDVYTQQRKAIVNAEEALIPWDVDVLYPTNWLELTARRSSLGERGTAAQLEDVELNRKLEETLPEVRFEEQPFEGVVEFLGELTKINIAVDWTDLEDNGIERDKPVTVRLAGLSFRTILDEVISQVGGDVQLAYAIGDGLLRVATKEKLDKDKLILIYDIRDLLVNIPRAMRTQAFDVTQGLGQGGQGGQGGGGGQGMFQQNQQQNQQGQEDQQGIGNEELIEQILDIIRQTVEPDSWRETGGGEASIRELNGQLIVYNTSAAHSQVGNLLAQLRETRALQISVEARFLNVVSNFLEEFGVDLDFVFNSGSAGYDRVLDANGNVLSDPFTGAPILVDRQYSRIGSYASPPGFGTPFNVGTVPQQPYGQAAFVPPRGGIFPHVDEMTPVTAQQGSLSLVDLTGRGTGVPGSFAEQAALTPALNIAGSFLDNLQVDFLIRATQANARSSIVQAPRLVLFNGQASSISVGRSRSYVSSLEPRLAEGAVGFEPEINTADSGVSLWVEGTISADRRYVTTTVNVQQREEPSFLRFEVQRASGSSPGAFILLPDFSFAIIQTTVSIPDGGTVLLGGLKQVGEIEVEAGVPILSKIPVLKRAFSNRSMVKDTRTLLILLKTKIIIQNEAEEEAFPTFSHAGM